MHPLSHFIHSFIHLFSKYLWARCCLCTLWLQWWTKQTWSPTPLNFMVSREVQTNKIVPLENTKSPTVVSVPEREMQENVGNWRKWPWEAFPLLGFCLSFPPPEQGCRPQLWTGPAPSQLLDLSLQRSFSMTLAISQTLSNVTLVCFPQSTHHYLIFPFFTGPFLCRLPFSTR